MKDEASGLLTVAKLADGSIEVTRADDRVVLADELLEYVQAHPGEGVDYQAGLLTFHSTTGKIAYRIVGLTQKKRRWIAERVS